ncbi:hypothetical protein BKA82DRAFT_1003452 [Pisolithus tinctorius]|uniref:Uncharacterized protein n=1 Tax=Pisolithus tinctorius Marx 270 TaxID=870435 RepID=A0A0C3JTX8_PISTI|nr:hypothetical protein BKA82DRAFT_1003452 [Pisolithus tinctorius]KIO00907.1 hypothetical protein M404DRAFT_1003452 [Pisolithus tinctorius Marx 270]
MCAINIVGDLPDRPSSSRVICIFVGRPTLEVSSLYLACCYAVSLAFRVLCFPHSALVGDASFIQFRAVVIEI